MTLRMIFPPKDDCLLCKTTFHIHLRCSIHHILNSLIHLGQFLNFLFCKIDFLSISVSPGGNLSRLYNVLDGGFHPYFSCFTHFLLVFLAYFSK